MPELPEVETVARALRNTAQGQRIFQVKVYRRDLRRTIPEALEENLEHALILRVRRRGKYLLMDLDQDDILVVHLGMSGVLRFYPPQIPVERGAHDHVEITLLNKARLVYSDPRRFGAVDLCRRENLSNYPGIKDLGPEPLSPEFTSTYLKARFKERQTPVKNALMDQRIIAGLGNIYICEALFQAGINPRRKAGNIGVTRIKALHDAIIDVLGRAIKAGGSSLKDYKHTDGAPGYFQHSFAVYGKQGQPCPGCHCQARLKSVETNIRTKTGIRKITQSGRSSFYCPLRQK